MLEVACLGHQSGGENDRTRSSMQDSRVWGMLGRDAWQPLKVKKVSQMVWGRKPGGGASRGEKLWTLEILL